MAAKAKTAKVDRPVIVRTYSAGVHFGYLVSRHGQEVVLKRAPAPATAESESGQVPAAQAGRWVAGRGSCAHAHAGDRASASGAPTGSRGFRAWSLTRQHNSNWTHW